MIRHTCPVGLRPYVKQLADDLRRNKLDVVAVPAPTERHPGHKVRITQGESPDWYRALCARHRSTATNRWGRAWYTKISRYDILVCLDKLAAGEGSTSKYAPELIAEAQGWAECEAQQLGGVW